MHGALAETFRDHFPWLVSRLFRRTGCREMAEDVAAETFARMARSPQQGDLRQPRAYLPTISKRLLQDMSRKKALEDSYLRMLQYMPSAYKPTPEDEMKYIQSILVIEQALAGLPDRAKAAFIYFRVDCLAHKDIAARLGVSVGMVRKYIAQGEAACEAAMISGTR